MLSALAALALAPAALTQDLIPDRKRSVGDNRAVLLTEAMAGAKTIAVSLFASSRYCPETPESHGRRHLLEHLLAKGSDGRLGERLEAASASLRADTHRDYLHVQIEAPAAEWKSALAAIAEILGPTAWSDEQVEAEKRILAQEFAILPDSNRLSRLAWQVAFGGRAPDPVGTAESLAEVAAGSLATLRRAQFAADGVTISIVGPAIPAELESAALALLARLPEPPRTPPGKRAMGVSGSVADELGGAAVFAAVPGYANPLAAWTMAAGLAAAAIDDERFFTYTPSFQPGLMIVGSNTRNDAEKLIAALRADPDRHFATGRMLAREWFARYRRSSSGRAYLNGAFQVQVVGGRPESMLDAIEAMRPEDFRLGVEQWSPAAGSGR